MGAGQGMERIPCSIYRRRRPITFAELESRERGATEPAAESGQACRRDRGHARAGAAVPGFDLRPPTGPASRIKPVPTVPETVVGRHDRLAEYYSDSTVCTVNRGAFAQSTSTRA